jgi:hypothetical protein
MPPGVSIAPGCRATPSGPTQAWRNPRRWVGSTAAPDVSAASTKRVDGSPGRPPAGIRTAPGRTAPPQVSEQGIRGPVTGGHHEVAGDGHRRTEQEPLPRGFQVAGQRDGPARPGDPKDEEAVVLPVGCHPYGLPPLPALPASIPGAGPTVPSTPRGRPPQGAGGTARRPRRTREARGAPGAAPTQGGREPRGGPGGDGSPRSPFPGCVACGEGAASPGR